MKKFLLAAAAIATLTGAAGAASAQAYGAPHRPGYNSDQRGDGYRDDDRRGGNGSAIVDAKQARVAQHIARGERSGALGRRDVRNLRFELSQIAELEQRFRMSRGLDRREVAILSNRLDRLDGQVIAEMRDGRGGNGGQPGNGYGDRDGRDGRGRGY